MKYKKKVTCRCCHSKRMYQYLNLGRQPLANSYHTGEKLPTFPLAVVLCLDCFHNQLSIVVNPDDMFRNYLYVSGTTETFRQHTKKLAEDAVSRIKKKNISVLDIACNDGTQLEFFRDFGCDVYGVDPAKNLRKITKKKNIPVLVDYWDTKIAERLGKKFDIITGTNVFAHVDDVDEFLTATRKVLTDDGMLILEFPYGDTMITHNEFDTVYHEHLSYFLVNSFALLAKRMEFSIVDVLRTPIHGGSIRFFLKNRKKNHCLKIKKLIEEEKQKGLLHSKTYLAYSNRVAKNKKDMRMLIRRLRAQKKKVIGYGASAKGNTMLNYFKIDLEYIIDDNELKWKYKTPGRDIPIKNPNTISKEKDDLYIVILAWNFYNEIAKRLIRLRGHARDTAVLYIPEIHIRHFSEEEAYLQSG